MMARMNDTVWISDDGTGLMYMRDLLVMDDDIGYLRSYACIPIGEDQMLAFHIP